ncbi:MAG TPA: iron-sulfur cluster repair di-iron protein [Fimbriiglobus sp.]|nr:iron-sulfur cluster repair di-iron protein [Fimbriiglobus sp.]
MAAVHENTVGEMVANRPGLARVFERFGIDYCCGGKRTLEDAATRAGADYAAVLAALEAADQSAGEFDPTALSLADLCEHIVETHHAYLRRELPRIDRLLDKVVAAHGERHPEVLEVRRVFGAFATDLVQHMAKEELVLFPAICRLEQDRRYPVGPFGSVRNPMNMMEAEHEEAGNALAVMRAATDDFSPPADACPTFRALLGALAELEGDMFRHVHKENNVLFPRAVRLEDELIRAGASPGSPRDLPVR